ncbi:ribose 1,5-bisphosphate phosphokinase PhnN [Alsobacter metallidurans]|uniref:Ribose 1,5-bisphosphate phosphokinase PhnN n=1 Tax=Alsobacter metallidurans TaxID=340221 RepID=A0A917MHC1_9HYPH|nr:phosphonate metabolism protein/1,5-bisphosphokinase (PRPP-forming) PhnN [Alsobacter metallidurans]GGH16044.1 ribose 1,5-bisphosphate phosphokinase PhnN [Alsobacter metallidurans]
MSQSRRIGPGHLVLVVGPSGAGKDTLIGLARDAFAYDPRVVFPRRLVTRLAGAFEDHDTFTEDDFLAGEAAGLYPLAWRAHGLCYALPPSVSEAVGKGSVVVANVSRAVLAAARERFANVSVVLVNAPPDVLKHRLAARGRSENIAERLARSTQATQQVSYDLEILNVGEPRVAAAVLNDLIDSALAGGAVWRGVVYSR